ncbi:unnamed protein product [Tilletia controversa]|uniref:Uncharacterized protein n=3 Tax=Tilletia TaxID=13289 RepID=A0A8X7MVQ9_9BASI|nr:hypothetical protein CF328_g3346 [Tilletia controversa]CAD6889127.1 unnamed protein product [Tilletia caries]CAD6943694.1 unnamed protein product [Tilletia laevis]KAE8249093.1 hypothetical protein A4X06_0g3386 [Tilletia controversa]CAD6916677.1 unnamed protein product [Tilletia controversa]
MAVEARAGTRRTSSTAKEAWAALEKLPKSPKVLESSAFKLLQMAEGSPNATEIEKTAQQLRDVLTSFLVERSDIDDVIKFLEKLIRFVLLDVIKAQHTKDSDHGDAWHTALRYSITSVSNALTDIQRSNTSHAYKLVQTHLVHLWAEVARREGMQTQSTIRQDTVIVATDALLQITTLDKRHRSDVLKHINIEELGQIFCNTGEYNVALDAMEIVLLTKPKNNSTAKRRHWEGFLAPWKAAMDDEVKTAGLDEKTKALMRQGLETTLEQLTEMKNEGRFDGIASDAIGYWSRGNPHRPQFISCSRLSSQAEASWLYAKPTSVDITQVFDESGKPQQQEDFQIWINSGSISIALVDPAFFMDEHDDEIAYITQRIDLGSLHAIKLEPDSADVSIQFTKGLKFQSVQGKEYDVGTELKIRPKDESEAEKLKETFQLRAQHFPFAIIDDRTNAPRLLSGVHGIPRVLADHLSEVPPALAKRHDVMAKSSKICRLPDRLQISELTPTASQSEVIRKRVDELQKGAVGSEGRQRSSDQAISDDWEEGGGLEPATKQQPAKKPAVEPKGKTARRSGNPVASLRTATATRGKLDLSDTPTNSHSILPSRPNTSIGLHPQKDDMEDPDEDSPAHPRDERQPSSVLSELSEEEEQSPSLRSRRRSQDEEAGDERSDNPSRPMRSLSLMVPPPPRKAERSRYTTKKKDTAAKGRENVHHDAAEETHMLQDIQAGRTKETENKELSTIDEVDYDTLPGEDAAESANIQKQQRTQIEKRQKKKASTKPAKKKEDAEDVKTKRGSKRKPEMEEEVSKKRKLSPATEDERGKGSPVPSRPSRKAANAGKERIRAMLHSSPIDESQQDGNYQVEKEAEPEREAITARSFLAAVNSSTPQMLQDPKARAPNRTLHPWNRPSQQSGAGTGPSMACEPEPRDGTMDRHSAVEEEIAIRKAGGGNKDLPMAESPFGRSGETQGHIINDAGLDREAFEHIALGTSGQGFDDAADGFDAGPIDATHLLNSMGNDKVLAEDLVDQEQVLKSADEFQHEEALLRQFINLDSPGREDEADLPGDTATDGSSDAEDLQMKKKKYLSAPADQFDAAKISKDTAPEHPRGQTAKGRQPSNRLRLGEALAKSEVARGKLPEKGEESEEEIIDAPVAEEPEEVGDATLTREKGKTIDRANNGPHNLHREQGQEDAGRAARIIDFSAIDSCAGSSTLVEPKSASVPVPKLHVARRAVSRPAISLKTKVAEARRVPEEDDPPGSHEQNQAAEDGLKHRTRTILDDSAPRSTVRSSQVDQPKEGSSLAKDLPRRESVWGKRTTTFQHAPEDKHANDPALGAALLAARKCRQTAHNLRENRERAAEVEEREGAETSARIESLAMELARVICKAELRQSSGMQLQARHDLRALMQDMYAELSVLEEQDAEVVETITMLRDYVASSRARLLRSTAQVREQVAQGVAEVREAIKSLRLRQ